ncbi:hypothetical protein GGD83_004437 [Rhodoblastus sphagnicola]|uniref:phosphohydrolase n=1 Tax=Rhodoblastus sphagnicola TaxID=333368 RepID=UPI001611ED83|nr:phosphohydrolase [Rhodoblastus sphagnicola]MBB4200608.1 hypothetical protein [Rhodoblastus sphagnicola]
MKHEHVDTAPQRAFILFRSGHKFNLLDPTPDSWTDEDLAYNLARIPRWAGATKWKRPLSVAQHSLLVLRIVEMQQQLTAREALRELGHDGSEALLGWDPTGPLKPHLGGAFLALDEKLQGLIDVRYRLPKWTTETYRLHKAADKLAAASEAFHVVGWSREELRDTLGIIVPPLSIDPLTAPDPSFEPWEPWPASVAESMFLDRLYGLLDAARCEEAHAACDASASMPHHT